MGCGASSEAGVLTNSALTEAVTARLYKATAANTVFLFGAETPETERHYAQHLVDRFAFVHIDAAAVIAAAAAAAAAASAAAAPASGSSPEEPAASAATAALDAEAAAASTAASAVFDALRARPAGSLSVVTCFPMTLPHLKAWVSLSKQPVPKDAAAGVLPHLALALQLDCDRAQPDSPAAAIAAAFAQIGVLRRLPSGIPPERGVGLLYRAALDLTAAATALPAPGLSLAVTPASAPLEVIFVVAAPGAQKKELCDQLASLAPNCEHISVGDELKSAIAATTNASASASAAAGTGSTSKSNNNKESHNKDGASANGPSSPVLSAADAAAVAAALESGALVPSEAAVAVLSAAIRARAEQGRRCFVVSGFPRGPEDRALWERAHAGVLSPAATVVVNPPPGEDAAAAAKTALAARHSDAPAVAAAKLAAWEGQTVPALAAAEGEPGAGGVVRVPAVSQDRGVAAVANAVRRALLGAGAPLPAGKEEIETTYAMIKPDAVAAGYTEAIIARITAAGFSIAARQDLTLTEEQAKAFYKEHAARPFYHSLVQFMCSGPIVALALRRKGAILGWRKLAGPTNSHRARAIAPNSLRATFGLDGSLNAVHGSDSRHSANTELSLIFGQSLPPGTLNALRGYRLILAGGPASGKGTQAELLRDQLGVVHISTGELLRDEKKKGTPLGLKAATYAEQGQLVPDDVMIPLVLQRVSAPDCARRGWLLDGFPRTAAQARALRAAGLEADVCVVISVPDEVLVERVAGRVMDKKTGIIYHEKYNPPPEGIELEKRADDTEEKARARIATFKNNVSEVKEVFGDIVVVIRGDRDKKAVFEEVLEQLPAAL